MIPGPIADHAFLPGEHPVARSTRRSLSATCLGASHGRSARRVPSARSRPRRRTATAQARARDLALMAAARSRDPPRADLAALGDEPAQRRNVLVVDPVDLVTAVRAGLAPTRGRSVLPVAPGASRPFTLLCQPGFLSDCVGSVALRDGRQTNVRSDRPADKEQKESARRQPEDLPAGSGRHRPLTTHRDPTVRSLPSEHWPPACSPPRSTRRVAPRYHPRQVAERETIC
jgi:hypothetical protein